MNILAVSENDRILNVGAMMTNGRATSVDHTVCGSNDSAGCCGNEAGEKGGTVPRSLGRIQRRDFVKAMGLGAAGLALAPRMSLGGAASDDDAYELLEDKDLDPEWVKSLLERGEPEVYTGEDLAYIGMPVGGICAGQVYLGGDGKLWLWDIFNQHQEGVEDKDIYLRGQFVPSTGGANFVAPPTPEYPFEQGFGLEVRTEAGEPVFRRLDYTGFEDIRFQGQYPVGTVTYQDAGIPVEVKLEAFSPFVPLDLEASSYPATVMAFTIKNTSDQPVETVLSGWLENPVCRYSGSPKTTTHVNRVEQLEGVTLLAAAAEQAHPDRVGKTVPAIEHQTDYGSMALAVMREGEVQAAPQVALTPAPAFDSSEEAARAPFGRRLTGALGAEVRLEPGEARMIPFVVAWHFPNLSLKTHQYDDTDPQGEHIEFDGRHYQTRFDDAAAVAEDLLEKHGELRELTFRWRDCFYKESTLPHWFLNRTLLNVSTLATQTCYRLGDGRFWAWEGIGCCAGTCTHVWQYAQGHARLFPEIEKILRAKRDFVEPAFNEETGVVYFRGNIREEIAYDGQAGIVLRSYRDHLMAPDDQFLRTWWPKIKKAMGWLIDKDAAAGPPRGILEGEQHNTYDAEWYGKIPFISSLYLAALQASAEMAGIVGDEAFAQKCTQLLEDGRRHFKELFNGDYFIQVVDQEAHPEAIAIGKGCHADQVIGQSWAFQLGLGRLLDVGRTRKALASIWENNFRLDFGPLRASLPPEVRGRPFALAGDKGLQTCTWPKGGKREGWMEHWQFMYFHEAWTGIEYQVAGHMIWEGMLKEGLAITRAIHDRYHPSKRNPYNEIECSDHYARALASYGVYLAACGYAYDGPAGELTFAPRLKPADFKTAFTAAEGWGTFAQQHEGTRQHATVELAHGRLRLKALTLEPFDGVQAERVQVEHAGAPLQASVEEQPEGKTRIVLQEEQTLQAGDRLSVHLG